MNCLQIVSQSKTVWWIPAIEKVRIVLCKKEIAEGRQVYVICPMVEESEGLEAENVLDYTKKVRQEMPPEISIGFCMGE